MLRKGNIAIVAALVLGLAPLGFAQAKTGKAANFTLSTPAQVGSAVLPTGNYEVKHVTSTTGHFMQFVRVAQSNLGFEGSPTYTDREVVATVNCNMQTLAATVGKTMIEKDGPRIARLEIKGENIAHNF